MLKTKIILFLFVAVQAQAAPKMDVGVGTPEPSILTVVPDSLDANLYYLFPQRFGLGQDANGDHMFSYQEYGTGFLKMKTEAQVDLVFVPQFNKKLVDEKIQGIKSQNPNAKFSFVSFVRAEINPPKIFLPVIADQDCGLKGILMGQDIVCRQKINSSGRDIFRGRMASGMSHVFMLNYSFVASISGKEEELWHSIAMYAGGVSEAKYYLDRQGRPLDPPHENLLAPLRFDFGNSEFINFAEAQRLWGLE